jgi:hypothetical protein
MTKKPDFRTKVGQFKKGTSGNPSGRPMGARNRATLMAEQYLEGQSEQLVQLAVKFATSGNILALRLCLDRALPIRKERTIELELPPAKNTHDLAANYDRVLAAVSEGRITPTEAQSLTEILDSQARLLENVDMERRLQELEECASEVREAKKNIGRQLEDFGSEYGHVCELIRAAKGTDEDAVEDAA